MSPRITRRRCFPPLVELRRSETPHEAGTREPVQRRAALKNRAETEDQKTLFARQSLNGWVADLKPGGEERPSRRLACFRSDSGGLSAGSGTHTHAMHGYFQAVRCQDRACTSSGAEEASGQFEPGKSGQPKGPKRSIEAGSGRSRFSAENGHVSAVRMQFCC